MPTNADSPLDLLWKEYRRAFQDFDDLTLARWLAQTLGQMQGKTWRQSHPLLAAYRLAAQLAHERQIWLMRLATPPAAYAESPCCRAPVLPLLTRDIREAGLICQHCDDTLVAFEDIPAAVRGELNDWAERYGPVHAVAHWDDRQRKTAGDYDRAFEAAAGEAEELLEQSGRILSPKLLECYPAVVWEDQDECLEVRPEDVRL
jgi:FAD/FMN-containing dehydrogenase